MDVLRNEKGVMLIMAIVALILFGLAAAVTVSLVVVDSDVSLQDTRSSETLYVGAGGVERTLWYLSREGGTCGGIGFANVTIGNGDFSSTGTLYNPAPMTLPVAIGAGNTTVRVASLAGFAPRGRVSIDSESLDYAGTGATVAACGGLTPPCLTGVLRGAKGTTAVAHAASASVSQYQCVVNVDSNEAALAGVTPKRVIEVTVQ